MVVTRSESKATKQQKEIHVVTGGGGFPGFTLGKRLAQSGHHVKLLDISEPVWELEDGMEFIKGSVVDKAVLAEVIAGASVVYHMASYGMSGKSQVFGPQPGQGDGGKFEFFLDIKAIRASLLLETRRFNRMVYSHCCWRQEDSTEWYTLTAAGDRIIERDILHNATRVRTV
ncbi:short-chain dehydrogenase/reductase family 42e member 1-like [Plakobranchus ocellatus]|uniref:Short-chain dehydrogenase/reductase family 42e member 1-like n=1 Tax=Plakobranchus ocellatus TaxID=259542 RepID=A0AAV4BX11_9GAST|nr:short-chain dehydrogenase/reductase family 42e member 1-like [Plakobranchus ocellatus]